MTEHDWAMIMESLRRLETGQGELHRKLDDKPCGERGERLASIETWKEESHYERGSNYSKVAILVSVVSVVVVVLLAVLTKK